MLEDDKEMKFKSVIIMVIFVWINFSALSYANNDELYSLTVSVDGLRNSKGIIQFTLYNQNDTIPDEEYKKYYKMEVGKINSGSSLVIFRNLPKGIYAINILHDENTNGKVDKGFIFPIEGLGFSNYDFIGLTNQPEFTKASFKLTSNLKKSIKIIYL